MDIHFIKSTLGSVQKISSGVKRLEARRLVEKLASSAGKLPLITINGKKPGRLCVGQWHWAWRAR